MQKYYVAIILAILFFFFVLTAIRAWRARAAKQEADFTQPPMALTDAGLRGFYERFMGGEKLKAGWVNDTDFAPAPLDGASKP